jgi:cytochrome d ubiquinol oxidase subunit I
MRTSEGTSPRVSAGNTLFTLIGFSGLYLVMGILFLYLVGREIAHGPGTPSHQTRMTRTPDLAGEVG